MEDDVTAKLLVLGSALSGKSTLIHKLTYKPPASAAAPAPAPAASGSGASVGGSAAAGSGVSGSLSGIPGTLSSSVSASSSGLGAFAAVSRTLSGSSLSRPASSSVGLGSTASGASAAPAAPASKISTEIPPTIGPHLSVLKISKRHFAFLKEEAPALMTSLEELRSRSFPPQHHYIVPKKVLGASLSAQTPSDSPLSPPSSGSTAPTEPRLHPPVTLTRSVRQTSAPAASLSTSVAMPAPSTIRRKYPPVILQFWELPETELVESKRASLKLLFEGADCIVIMFRTPDIQSLEILDKWREVISSFGIQVPLILLSNRTSKASSGPPLISSSELDRFCQSQPSSSQISFLKLDMDNDKSLATCFSTLVVSSVKNAIRRRTFEMSGSIASRSLSTILKSDRSEELSGKEGESDQIFVESLRDCEELVFEDQSMLPFDLFIKGFNEFIKSLTTFFSEESYTDLLDDFQKDVEWITKQMDSPRFQDNKTLTNSFYAKVIRVTEYKMYYWNKIKKSMQQ